MKYVLIGRSGTPEKREAEASLVMAFGGNIYQLPDGSQVAELADHVPVSQSALMLPIQAIPPTWERVA